MPTVDVLMPKMGESITEGTVNVWHKKVGDEVALDEGLLDIGTDKVDTEIPAPSAGVLVEILVPEGATVDVGTTIARIQSGAVETAAASPAPAEPQPSASKKVQVPVVMPKMGESITEGTVIAWHKRVGDPVALDEALLDIGTDKVDTEVPSPAVGTLAAILVEEGATVDVGTHLGLIATGEEVVMVEPTSAPKLDPPRATAVSEDPVSDTAPSSRHLSDGRFLTPLVRAISRKEGVTKQEIEAIKGSGSRGRVTKQDLLDYLETRRRPEPQPKPEPKPIIDAPAPAPAVLPDSRETVIEMDRQRQLVAHHMSLSRKTAAHVTSFAEVDATNLVRLREANRERFYQRHGIRLTYTPFFVYAAVEALRSHPMLNASVDGTRIILKKDFHVGIAVNIDKTGLVVPVIKHAGRQRIAGLAHAAYDLAARARSKELRPDDLQGGTFTLTNLGSLGSIMGTPIILQPQVAILATGFIQKRPVVIEDPNLGDIIAIRQMLYLSLSYDHRIIDGAMGTSFLRKIASVVENFDPTQEI